MEQNFQTSFIPKKPIVEERARPSMPMNIFTVIGVFLLFAAGIATGGLYFYKNNMSKSIAQMATDLELAKNRFEPERLSQLQRLDKKLRASNEVLKGHIAVSPIFEALGEITLPTVRYTNFSYESAPLGGSALDIKMEGVAVGYRSIALQSDLFLKNKNLIDPVFANLILDEKGNVKFDLTFKVDPQFVDYQELLKLEEVEGGGV